MRKRNFPVFGLINWPTLLAEMKSRGMNFGDIAKAANTNPTSVSRLKAGTVPELGFDASLRILHMAEGIGIDVLGTAFTIRDREKSAEALIAAPPASNDASHDNGPELA